ncbi:uncharacterized protein FA14DRAFT_87752 [Meira miltonrushii]|uniref:Uncharacterized protein n=1 Tax=Meira miltonrushii TaxID=1280837 RepID=A0A316V497_9BASI|nr:uncharacterized protein FA14DRAFT_87752 [Meira miltonrushii]PWN32379.1 hypothetical protein FA14DRAFT_87752 [Meira miltonrushii]
MHRSSFQALTNTSFWVIVCSLIVMTVNALPAVYSSHLTLPDHAQKLIMADDKTIERKGPLGQGIQSTSHSRSHILPMMMVNKRSINTEASIAASSAASSASREVYQMATSHAAEMQAQKLYNVKQVSGLATVAGLTGIGIGSSAHAGMNKVPKHVAVHRYPSRRTKH